MPIPGQRAEQGRLGSVPMTQLLSQGSLSRHRSGDWLLTTKVAESVVGMKQSKSVLVQGHDHTSDRPGRKGGGMTVAVAEHQASSTVPLERLKHEAVQVRPGQARV